MKRSGIMAAVIGVGVAVLSFSPSLDGRAAVASSGDMPQGMFAKTVGYLPGDNITVTNLATHDTADILVVGALDPSQGIAISLSPEAASVLGIERGSDVMVKLTRRTGMPDEVATGSAVISAAPPASVSPPVVTPPAQPRADEPIENKRVAEEPSPSVPSETTQPIADNVPPASENVPPATAPLTAENVPPIDDAPAPSSPVVESLPAPSLVAAVPYEKINPSPADEDERAMTERTPAVAEPSVPDVPSAEPQPVVIETVPALSEKPAPANPVYEVVVKEENVLPPPEIEEPSVPNDVLVIREEAATPPAELPQGDTPPSPAVYERAATPAPSLSDASSLEATTVKECNDVSETNAVLAAAPPDVSETPAAYAPIVLVPTAPKAPPAGLTQSNAAAPRKAESAVPAVSMDEVDRLTVPSMNAFKRGEYYVQFATFHDKANARAAVHKYSSDYPMVFVPTAKSIQAFIGPLNVDEYGAVLSRFRSDGFNDAFLRKIR